MSALSWKDQTKRDQAAGLLGPELAYRLPSAVEWLSAAGSEQYPWGSQWPPGIGAGNFASDEAKTLLHGQILRGYRDSFAGTAPVASFQPNFAGFYDLAGNAAEWMGTWYTKEAVPLELRQNNPGFNEDGGGQSCLQLRGGSWACGVPVLLSNAASDLATPEVRSVASGFRCVVGRTADNQTVALTPRTTVVVFQEDPGGLDNRLIGIWEAKLGVPGGSSTFRWEQEPDGSYTTTNSATGMVDAGHLLTGGEQMRQQSKSTGLTSQLRYRFPSRTQLATEGSLGKSTWRRIADTTNAMRKDGLAVDQSDANQGGDDDQPSTPRPRSRSPRNGERDESVGRRARSIGDTIRRHLPF